MLTVKHIVYLGAAKRAAPDSTLRFRCGITYSTMDRKTLEEAWELLEAARRGRPTADDLEQIAKMLGRKLRAGGNHPVWVTNRFPRHRPLPIERHGGNPPIPPHAKKVIVNGLEADAAAWEEALEAAERKARNGGTNGAKGNS